MELKDKLLSSFLTFEEHVNVNTDIHEMRTRAIKDFEQMGLPDTTQ